MAGESPMITANSLHVAVHLIVSSGASFKWLLSCCRACRAGAFTPHFAQPSNVQTSCLDRVRPLAVDAFADGLRSEEHTSELQSLMRISYAVFCLKKILSLTQHSQLPPPDRD